MKIEAIFEKKRALEEQISTVKDDLAKLPNKPAQQIELGDWRRRLESLVYLHSDSTGHINKTREADAAHIKEKIEQLSSQLEQRAQDEIKVRAHLAKLTDELAALDLTVSLKELITLQDKVTEAEKLLNSLNEAVTTERGKIDGDEHSNIQTLVALNEERENLLADIASGEQVDEIKLQQIEKQIAAEESAHEKHVDSFLTASQTITGLTRKIAMVEDVLSVARQNLSNAFVSYITTEIDQAGKEYVKIAGKLSSAFMRVISLAELCEKQGVAVNVFGPYTYQFQIPSLTLDVCREHELNDMAGMLFRFLGANRPEYVKSEIQRLESLGLNLCS